MARKLVSTKQNVSARILTDSENTQKIVDSYSFVLIMNTIENSSQIC